MTIKTRFFLAKRNELLSQIASSPISALSDQSEGMASDANKVVRKRAHGVIYDTKDLNQVFCFLIDVDERKQLIGYNTSSR